MTLAWETYAQQQDDAATVACIAHRRQFHLGVADVDSIVCEMGCLVWTSCPLAHPQNQPVIDRFFGRYIFLSNFYVMTEGVPFAGEVYPSVEHAFQAAKTLSPVWRERVRRCATPKAAKALGRTVPLRADWEPVKLPVMLALLRAKFAHPRLKAKLLATRDALLVEGNTWGDRFWGLDRATGLGLNHLGRLLMQVRREVAAQPERPNPALTRIRRSASTRVVTPPGATSSR